MYHGETLVFSHLNGLSIVLDEYKAPKDQVLITCVSNPHLDEEEQTVFDAKLSELSKISLIDVFDHYCDIKKSNQGNSELACKEFSMPFYSRNDNTYEIVSFFDMPVKGESVNDNTLSLKLKIKNTDGKITCEASFVGENGSANVAIDSDTHIIALKQYDIIIAEMTELAESLQVEFPNNIDYQVHH